MSGPPQGVRGHWSFAVIVEECQETEQRSEAACHQIKKNLLTGFRQICEDGISEILKLTSLNPAQGLGEGATSQVPPAPHFMCPQQTNLLTLTWGLKNKDLLTVQLFKKSSMANKAVPLGTVRAWSCPGGSTFAWASSPGQGSRWPSCPCCV